MTAQWRTGFHHDAGTVIAAPAPHFWVSRDDWPTRSHDTAARMSVNSRSY
jgi:hypothetical protein